MNTLSPNKVKLVRRIIILASIAIPLVVAILFKVKIPGQDMSFLPAIYAGINAGTALLLVLALVAIKMKNRKLHESFIRICMFLSLVFLALYVTYHMTSESTIYGDLDHNGELTVSEEMTIAGSQLFYRIILISHILLSLIIVPLVLFTYLFAWQGDFVKHRKWTRFTWPIWFYVAVSGVIVYLMISPYYV